MVSAPQPSSSLVLGAPVCFAVQQRNHWQILCCFAGFDSHFSSVGKEYCYKVNCGVPQPMQV
jgi:hypothetical protein